MFSRLPRIINVLSFAQDYQCWNLDSVSRHSVDTPSVRGPRVSTAASFPMDESSAFLLFVDAALQGARSSIHALVVGVD